MPAMPLKYQVDQSHHDQSSGHESYSPSSTSSSKHTSPAPSNRSESNRGSPTPKGSKGKLFQCTGFGDCRMVFTRSEHLARHARKHTGEKPFQCVVDGCTRMFSRFDNMVQHTQTHTKGARRESAAGIASKIAAESRRKSEAGLLGSSEGARGVSKASKAKRGSTSSISSFEVQQIAATRKSRIHSMPVIAAAAPSSLVDSHRERTLTKETASNHHSSRVHAYEASTRTSQDSNKIHKKIPKTLVRGRRASVTSSTSTSSLSWYASKLHHKPSLDGTSSSSSSFGRQGSLDAHLPPLNLRQFEYAMDQSSFRRPRHPLSPDRSSHSEDDDDEDEDSDGMEYSTMQHHHRSRREERQRQQQQQQQHWDSVALCTLPPLRSPTSSDAHPMRLPSISSSGYRSRSISYECHIEGESYAPKVRRLSVADLETPIYETKKVVDQSIQAQQAQFEGVDVSEKEIYALEAFGELWSQGRDVGMEDLQLSSSFSSSSRRASVMKSEFDQPVPGLDDRRRSSRGVVGAGEDMDFYRPLDSKITMEMTMDLD
ncbi:hypothetical protein EDD21DRAFT_330232 [Dissophora ornata]|nr:hypothetical protein EDD21DRAFT_330232 [Dissophora ornata]